ncbi:UNVERIFIED_CONTAM: hypothetical protein Slati_3678900 [Sesamum latifolium]|uniref:Endonuclease/exonuclease/phosphatase n=1 Tax=Sesamum latifolium TaxID=2727402 RepID=A0AAW2U240_9LAMI
MWNRQGEPHTVQARLDRACSNYKWHSKFSGARVSYLPLIHSDHRPILVETQPSSKTAQGRKQKRFRFEAMWLRSKHCEEVVSVSWNAVNEADPNVSVREKVKSCRLGLIQWEKTEFENVKRGIKELEDRIAQRQEGHFDAASSEQVHGLMQQLEEFRSKEEILWQQCSKVHWLRDWDCNTKFFHTMATTRKKA